MHCVAGLDRVTDGQVFVGDTEVWTIWVRKLTCLRRHRIGFIFQAFDLAPTMAAVENIVLPMSLAGHEPGRTGTRPGSARSDGHHRHTGPAPQPPAE